MSRSKRGEHPAEIDALSLYRALEQMSDQRHKRGVRYPLALILSLVVLGKLAGMTSLAGIAEWVRLRADWLQTVLPLPCERLPCASTYGNVLSTVEVEELTRLVADPLTRLDALRRCGAERESAAHSARRVRAACPGRPRWENTAWHARAYGA